MWRHEDAQGPHPYIMSLVWITEGSIPSGSGDADPAQWIDHLATLLPRRNKTAAKATHGSVTGDTGEGATPAAAGHSHGAGSPFLETMFTEITPAGVAPKAAGAAGASTPADPEKKTDEDAYNIGKFMLPM